MRQVNKLTAAKIRSIDLTKPKLHLDGGNLYLQVSKYGTLAWVFRYMKDGVPHTMGLGGINDFSLVEARERARAQRQKLRDDVDPLAERRKARAERRAEAAKAMTFKQCAEAYIDSHRAGWSNAKHAKQWPATLEAYVYPTLGSLPVQSIDTALIVKVLQPFWVDRNETMSRVRARIEAILGWATTSKFRQGDNPARWRGHLANLLPKPSAVQDDKHHAALPYGDVPRFMAKLRALEGVTARCLEFLILCACRAGEASGARWSEFDLAARTWTVPGSRMKSGNEHRVSLSDRALAILADLPPDGALVFPGVRVDRLLALVRELGEAKSTTHGFRSSFADWLAESTAYPRELGEIALAHTVGDDTERAYRRSDLLAKRARMMADWSEFCLGPPAERGEVIPIRASAS